MTAVGEDTDKVFKALADPTRRYLLDRLYEENGQSLGELCERLQMARQSVTQHLEVLGAANLVTTVRRGREKLHYLNAVPIHELEERWIYKFERPRLRALCAIKQRAEEAEMAGQPIDKPTFVYVTYIQSTPERVWEALTDAKLSAEYWGHSNISDWGVGSRWEHRRTDGSGIADVIGTVLEAEPPRRLVITFDGPDEQRDPPSRVTFDIERYEQIIRLTVIARGHRRGGQLRRRFEGLAGGARQPQIAIGDGPRPPATAMGNVRRAQRLASGTRSASKLIARLPSYRPGLASF